MVSTVLEASSAFEVNSAFEASSAFEVNSALEASSAFEVSSALEASSAFEVSSALEWNRPQDHARHHSGNLITHHARESHSAGQQTGYSLLHDTPFRWKSLGTAPFFTKIKPTFSLPVHFMTAREQIPLAKIPPCNPSAFPPSLLQQFFNIPSHFPVYFLQS